MATKRAHSSTRVFLPEEQVGRLRRRAARARRQGNLRKASIAWRQVAALTGEAGAFASLGHALLEAGQRDEGLDAFRQSLWLHRRAGAQGRAWTVAQLILEVDPADARAAQVAKPPRAA